MGYRIQSDAPGEMPDRVRHDGAWVSLTRFVLIIGAAIASIPLPAGAVDSSQESTQMEEVVVKGRRQKDSTAQSTLILTEEYKDRLVGLSDVLESAPGVRVSRFGGLGSFATLSIRGSSSEQTQIYLDGIPLNPAQGGGIDLSTLPFDLLESIEIFRGQTPSEFGSAGIGGTVDLRTHQPIGTHATRIKASGGSFETLSGSGFHSGHFGRLRYLLGVDSQHSLGDFDYLDDNGTPFNPEDDERVERTNNRSLAVGGLGRMEIEIRPKIVADLSLMTFNKDQGVPGLGNLRSTAAELNTERRNGRVSLTGRRLSALEMDTTLSIFSSFMRQGFKDELNEVGIASQSNSNRTFGLGASARNALPLGDAQQASLLLEVRNESFRPRDYLYPDPLTSGRRTTAVAVAQDEVYFGAGRFLVAPALRAEWISDHRAEVHPETEESLSEPTADSKSRLGARVGARYQPLPPLTATANAGRYFRHPDFMELYGDRGFLIGNPDLKPESSWNADVGLRYEIKPDGIISRIRVGASLYTSRASNLIQFVQNSQNVAYAANFDAIRTVGVETEAGLNLLRHLALNLTSTHQRAEDASSIAGRKGKIVPGRPTNEIFAGTEIFGEAFRVFHEVEFVEGNFLDAANYRLVPPRWIHAAGATLKFLVRYSATAEVKNITNRPWMDFHGYPLPGRSYFGSVSAEF